MRPRVYLDANIFIEAMETAGASGDHAWWLLDAATHGEIALVTSELTLAEVLVRPQRDGAADIADAYRGMLVASDVLDLRAVDRDISEAAAQVRAGRGSIRLPDAIHLATARAAEARYFVSRDRDIPMRDDRVVRLDGGPYTLDRIRRDHP